MKENKCLAGVKGRETLAKQTFKNKKNLLLITTLVLKEVSILLGKMFGVYGYKSYDTSKDWEW